MTSFAVQVKSGEDVLMSDNPGYITGEAAPKSGIYVLSVFSVGNQNAVEALVPLAGIDRIRTGVGAFDQTVALDPQPWFDYFLTIWIPSSEAAANVWSVQAYFTVALCQT
jgi:TctA family transporter